MVSAIWGLCAGALRGSDWEEEVQVGFRSGGMSRRVVAAALEAWAVAELETRRAFGPGEGLDGEEASRDAACEAREESRDRFHVDIGRVKKGEWVTHEKQM
jgi:hypothetical protein